MADASISTGASTSRTSSSLDSNPSERASTGSVVTATNRALSPTGFTIANTPEPSMLRRDTEARCPGTKEQAPLWPREPRRQLTIMETVGFALLAMSIREADTRLRVATEGEALRQVMIRLDGDRAQRAFKRLKQLARRGNSICRQRSLVGHKHMRKKQPWAGRPAPL